MKPEFLKLLRCPYCGSDFEIGDIYEEKEGEINYGCIECACDEFPVIEGILSLEIGDRKRHVLESLKKGKWNQAARYLMKAYVEDTCRIAAFLERKRFYGAPLSKILLFAVDNLIKHTHKKYWDTEPSFCDLLDKNDFYSKHRFSAESFWSIYPFIPLLKQNKKRILDIGCGRGHSSFVISTYISPDELVCADRNFRNLYLAKKYMVKDANFVCLDANYPLPFKNKVFSSTIMLDSFHYVDARALLAAEIERTLLPEGLLLLLHVHNSLVHNTGAGKPLPPWAWINLFKHFDVRALPERKLIEDFILRSKLDLTKEYPTNELNASNALCIVGTRDKSLFRTFDKVWDDFIKNKDNLMINPLYEIKREGSQVALQRKSPNDLFNKEYPLTMRYLPQRCVLDGELFKSMESRALSIIPEELSVETLNYIENLMKKFVIINLPKGYWYGEDKKKKR